MTSSVAAICLCRPAKFPKKLWSVTACAPARTAARTFASSSARSSVSDDVPTLAITSVGAPAPHLVRGRSRRLLPISIVCNLSPQINPPGYHAHRAALDLRQIIQRRQESRWADREYYLDGPAWGKRKCTPEAESQCPAA